MITSWIFAENLRPFLTVLAWIVVYDFDPDEWVAISFGIEGTDDEMGRWYDYEFTGESRARLRLARDAESDLVHLRVELPTSLEPQVELAVSIFSRFRVQDVDDPVASPR